MTGWLVFAAVVVVLAVWVLVDVERIKHRLDRNAEASASRPRKPMKGKVN